MGNHNRYTLEYQMCPRIGVLVQYKMMYRHPLQVYESRQPESQHHSKQNYVVYNNWQTLTENNHLIRTSPVLNKVSHIDELLLVC